MSELKSERFKQIRNIAIAVAFTLLIACAAVTFVFRPRALEAEPVDLSTVEDGSYVGIYQNKILLAVVQVNVNNHEIVGIEVLRHKDSYMEQAEMIANTVLAKQSLEVDAISGATLTSDTVLKAIEDALKQGAR